MSLFFITTVPGFPTNHELAVQLFLQLAVILAIGRLAGILFKYLGQTQVVSEMIAGVLLGPSFLGFIAPNVQTFLFPISVTLNIDGAATPIPHPSMTILYALSQIGLVLYMFLIGLQFNFNILNRHLKEASVLSLLGVLSPFILGGLLGLFVADDSRLFTANIATWQAALFMSAAMLITAFPMLARIIYESGFAGTKIGTLTLSAAAFDDAIAWIMLAIVVASAKNSLSIAIITIGGGILYAGIMIFLGRPAFRLFKRVSKKDQRMGMDTLSLLLFVLVLCAWFTDAVGIYSIFGAFIAGVVMPRGNFVDEVSSVVERLNVTLFLPVFFVYSGLNTQIGLINNPSLIGITIVTIIVAFLCKGGACFFASRISGGSLIEASMIGGLMNARGLMELILVNIGLENNIISPALFTILVLMAVATTFVASPLFKFLYKLEQDNRLKNRDSEQIYALNQPKL
ncbi:MAG: cation:proton antiporter [Pleurocapsa sp. SU_5_0]|nr:cation:proton antiporter [Pleurocapsa sp. SU_5_0]NJR45944.1 cation:proton antiporter [Hyellaceae cyanobacterium CSU_1_1]